MSVKSSSSRHSGPTRVASVSRGTGVGEAKITASTRPIHSRQRAACGSSPSSGSNGGLAFARAMSEPVEPKRRPAGQLPNGAEARETLQKTAGGAVGAEIVERGRCDRIIGEEHADARRTASGSDLAGDRQETVAPAAEVDGLRMHLA